MPKVYILILSADLVRLSPTFVTLSLPNNIRECSYFNILKKWPRTSGCGGSIPLICLSSRKFPWVISQPLRQFCNGNPKSESAENWDVLPLYLDQSAFPLSRSLHREMRIPYRRWRPRGVISNSQPTYNCPIFNTFPNRILPVHNIIGKKKSALIIVGKNVSRYKKSRQK